MAFITREHALIIARKLKATVRKSPTHERAEVYEGGKLIAHFGIRRGSRKDIGHDHIPSEIYTSPHNTLLLGRCPWKREDWIRNMSEKGML
jgi:hypothetical protein